MCKAKHYTEQLVNIYNNINNDLNKYLKEQKVADGLILDLLHIIENENFNAVQGYKLAKMLKEARIQRRNAKMELETLKKLHESFVNKNMKELEQIQKQISRTDRILNELQENKVYNPRVLKTIDIKVITSNDFDLDNNIKEYKEIMCNAIIKKNGERVKVIREENENQVCVVRCNGIKNVLNKKDIEFCEINSF